MCKGLSRTTRRFPETPCPQALQDRKPGGTALGWEQGGVPYITNYLSFIWSSWVLFLFCFLANSSDLGWEKQRRRRHGEEHSFHWGLRKQTGPTEAEHVGWAVGRRRRGSSVCPREDFWPVAVVPATRWGIPIPREDPSLDETATPISS